MGFNKTMDIRSRNAFVSSVEITEKAFQFIFKIKVQNNHCSGPPVLNGLKKKKKKKVKFTDKERTTVKSTGFFLFWLGVFIHNMK